jgi:hypothetical protein
MTPQRWRWVAAGAVVLLLLGVFVWWWKRRGRMDIVTKARSYIGVITAYSMAKYDAHTADCSEFLWRVLGKKKDQGGIWWGADRIFTDAQIDQVQFKRVAKQDVQPGDIAVYAGHTANGVHHAGHVAFVSDPSTHTIIDCSQSQNGVHEHVDLLAHFWFRPDAIFCRYIG